MLTLWHQSGSGILFGAGAGNKSRRPAGPPDWFRTAGQKKTKRPTPNKLKRPEARQNPRGNMDSHPFCLRYCSALHLRASKFCDFAPGVSGQAVTVYLRRNHQIFNPINSKRIDLIELFVIPKKTKSKNRAEQRHKPPSRGKLGGLARSPKFHG